MEHRTGRKAVGFLVALASLVFSLRSAAAGDWPAVQGDMAHSGVTAQSLELPLARAWVMQADHAPSPAFPKGVTGRFAHNPAAQDYVYQPVIQEQQMVFGSSTEEAVYCLDTESGSISWKVHLDGAIRVAPVWNKGKVYVGTDGGSVYCLEGATGRQVWRFRAGPTSYSCIGNDRIVSTWPVRGGLVVVDGKAYFAAGVYPTLGVYLYAVRADTGALVWGRPIEIAPNGCLRIVDGDKLWVSSGAADPAEFQLSDGKPVIPHPDRRRGRGGWWLGDVCGLPAWGPADNDLILFRLSTDTPPGKWRNSSVTQDNVLPRGILTGIHGLCAIGDDRFYLLAPDNEVMAVPLPAFREACAQRAQEIQAMKVWSYGWVMAAELPEDKPFAEAVRKRAAWTVRVPDEKAAGLRWGIKAGPHLFLGGMDCVVALDAATGDAVWSQPVDGEALGLAAADDALFVSTDKGKLYCFRHGATQAAEHAPSFGDPYDANAVYEEAARTALEAVNRKRGYCLVLGVGEGELAYRIARQSEFFVVGLDRDADRVDAARRKLARAGVYGSRVVVYHEPNDPPALVGRFANLVVSDDAITEGAVPYVPKSVLRMVQPYGGTVMLGSPKCMDIGADWRDPQFLEWEKHDGKSGTAWWAARRGALPGAGEWTHLYGNPANTVCSGDTLVSSDFRLQWFGLPGMPDMVERHSMAMCPLVKNGIIYRMGAFYPTANSATSLTAIDAYNGTRLWSARFPHSGRKQAGHNTHSYACIGDFLFVNSAGKCLQLEGASGQLVRTFEGVKPGFDYGYVGGWNHYLIGTSQGTDVNQFEKPYRLWGKNADAFSSRPASSRDLFAYDLRSGERLWTYEGGAILNVSITGDTKREMLYFVESTNSTAMNDTTGQIEFGEFLAPEGDKGARIVALDMKTGEERWSQPIRRNVDDPQQWIMYLTLADDVLLTSRTYFEKQEDGNLRHGYDFEALDVEAEGRTLWQKWLPVPGKAQPTWKNPLHSHPFYARGKFYFMARYYGAVYSFEPRTGAETVDSNFGQGWQQSEAKSCTTPSASESAFYFRRNSHFLYDLETQKIKDMTRVSRPACWMSMIPAGGLITMLEQSTGCKCGFAIRLSVVFAAEADEAGL